MREPRPEDFDPNYKLKVRPEEIDLSGVMPIKPKPPIIPRKTVEMPADKSANERTVERANARTAVHANGRTGERANERTDEQVNVRTKERPFTRTGEHPSKQRKTVRYSFQFYADQVAELKRLRAQLELNGEDKDLSQLAREAFDAYLTEIRERTAERENERSAEQENG
ncbi:MAG: hypothetical protein L0332_30820 [Chloroflexi bacterium]|nr:hypothetical protein [Chloroflexota bacterium]MCI0731093.1 hypothetical protein [Chloroflexota bacterium]